MGRHEGMQKLVNASCVDMRDVRLYKGYGYAKVTAVLHAPARHVLWVDADAWFVGDPLMIFRSAGYRKTGTAFFPDFYRFFSTDAKFWAKVRTEQHSPEGLSAAAEAPLRETYPGGLWYAEAGFDSGLFAVDKVAAKLPLLRLQDLVATPQDAYWRDRSMGDKDLWKLAFVLSSHNVSLSPMAGIIGYWDPKAVSSVSSLIDQIKTK